MDSLLSMLLPLLFSLFSFNPATSYASQISYTNHCDSIVPSTPIINTNNNKRLINTFPFGDHHSGYLKGGDSNIGLDSTTWSQFSFYLKPRNIQATQDSHLYKLEALISFRSTNMWNFSYGDRLSYGSRRHQHPYSVTFKLEGFWSESSGKICMVGTGKGYSKTGESLNLDAVFKLNNVFSSSNVSSLISGTLKTLNDRNDRSYFEPISVLMFPKRKYNYTLDSVVAESEFSSGSDDEEQGLPLNFNSFSFCSYPLSSVIGMLQLEYSSDCNSSKKNCSPMATSENLPTLMSLRGIECSNSEKLRMRVMVEFFNTSSYYYGFNNQGLNPKNMLIGEGWWSEKSNMLCVVACHVMTDMASGTTHVGDCSVRLRLSFPSIWSIKSTSTIVGQIWSNKTAKENGFFKRITFRNDDQQQYGFGGIQGSEYEYSQLKKVNKSCKMSKQVRGQGKSYPIPDENSYNMRFDMSIRESKKIVAWGYSLPLSIGDKFSQSNEYSYSISSSPVDVPPEIFSNNHGSLFNISYKISISPMSHPSDKDSLFNKSFEMVKIAAEGIYDAEGGNLCMVGCRDLPSNNGTPVAHSVDCEILLKFQFPPLGNVDGSRIKGSIKSMRKESDPLYFKKLDLLATSYSYYTELGRRNSWRMDLEVIMTLISTTLACVFTASQLYYVKRNPNVLPFISLTMMSILTFSHAVPLVLNLEALFSQNSDKKNFVGWFEVNEITVRLITVVAFALQSRILYLTWSSRKTNEGKENLWSAERMATFVTLPLYGAGLMIALVFKLKNRGNNSLIHYYRYGQRNPSALESFKSYGGLVIDGFLLPQILLNIFSNMRGAILSYPFYFGTTFVRLLPHAYDLYRAHNYAEKDEVAYFYADPSADFYSTAWDIAIPLGGIFFAVVIYLQQHFGALCILPSRFKGSNSYEKLPVVAETEAAEMETTNM